jgi:hypothetical protein
MLLKKITSNILQFELLYISIYLSTLPKFRWEVDYMEVEYKDVPKYKFYDSKLVKKE